MTDVRKRIIDSVFSKRNAAGKQEEIYVAHVKIWEDVGDDNGGRKPRYILLSQAINRTGFIHKSKLNTNGTFSVGKTWKLTELRAIQVVNPLVFNITMSRTYKWQSENREDQANFLEALVRLFRTLTVPQTPLYLDGLHDYNAPVVPQSATLRDSERMDSAPSPTRRIPWPQTALAEAPERAPSPKLHSHNGSIPSRSDSPVGSLRDHRPPSIVVPPLSSSFQRSRKPSNATETSTRIPATDVTLNRTVQERSRVPSRATNNSSPTPSMRSRRIENNNAHAIEPTHSRRDHKGRISFFDPSNQAMLDRLILESETLGDVEGDEENAQATLASIEEMIEGYEWASDDVIGRKTTKGAVDMIEARLIDELTALEKANIHSFLEFDDRVGVVTKYIDNALSELNNIEGFISSYKIHLSAVDDDISFIQSQNRGLQVQTQNQRALLAEIQNLLRTVHVDQEALTTLTQESLEKSQSIRRLEEAAVQLYKALQAGRDTDMAATMERLQEYRTFNTQFCKRLLDFLSIMFVAQSKLLLGDTSGIIKGIPRPKVIPHTEPEDYLGRYSGLMLYLREMDESVYSKLCGAYFSAASDLHNTQIKALLVAHLDLVRKATEEEIEQGKLQTDFKTECPLFQAGSMMVPHKPTTLRRAGTMIKSPREGRQKDQERSDGDQRASEVFGLWIEQVATLVYREDEFITNFLQIHDGGFTFADFMDLDNYFRRQAARSASLKQTTLKLIRGALDLIFGFLPTEMKAWLDAALTRDNMELFGIMAFLERFQIEAEEKGNLFVIGLLEKQHSRLKMAFDRHVIDQLKGIEHTKLSSKRRKGVAQFVKVFPGYASRIENQLIGANTLEIRTNVDSAYEKITQAMFDSLKQMAKLEGEGEDKGQLNYHVILIENMCYFSTEVSEMDVASLSVASRKAEAMYQENLSAYVKFVFRRPFGRIIVRNFPRWSYQKAIDSMIKKDFFEGVDRVDKGNPSEVASNSNYNKTALRKVIKEYNSKDIKKCVEVLAKRVEKHFMEGQEKDDSAGVTSAKILNAVWKTCEDEFVKLTETWTSRIFQLYGDSSISLEYTPADVESAFRRQRLGS